MADPSHSAALHARLEPAAALLLGVHGAAMLAFTGGTPWQWAAVGSVVLVAGPGLLRGHRGARATGLRLAALLAVTWLLLASTGGTGSFFLLWYFVLVPVYALVLRRRQALAFLGVVAASYLSLEALPASTVPLLVVGARAALLFFIGWIVLTLGQQREREAEERRALERTRQQETAWYQDALDAGGLGTWDWDLATGKVIWSSNVEALFHLARGSFTGTFEAYFALIHPNDRPALEEHIKTTRATGHVFLFDHRILLPDGSTRWLRSEGRVDRDEDDRPRRMSGTVQDVTERRQMERALHHKEARLAEAQRIAHLGNWSWDLVTGEQYWSEELYRIYGLPPSTLASFPTFLACVHPDDRALVEQTTHDAPDLPEGVTLEFRIVRPDGTVRTVWSEAEMILAGEDTPVRMAGTVLDVTDRKQAEAAARQAEAELLHRQQQERALIESELQRARQTLVRQTRLATIGQVAASIAHELRNPLGTIRNAAYVLKRRAADTTLNTEPLDLIEHEVEAANRIIINLLAMGRAKAPVPRQVDLGSTLREAYARVKGSARVELHCCLGQEPFVVGADPDQLRQVLINLLANASQAMKGEGRIAVRARHEANGDVITIRDTGPGVAPALHDEIFEPLFTTRASGTGLGLSICRQLVEGHGGTLELVQDDDPGAAFRLVLPLLKENSAAARAKSD